MLNNNKVLIYCEQQVYDISHFCLGELDCMMINFKTDLCSVYDQVLNWTH